MHRLGALALLLAGCAVSSIDYAELDAALATARCERLVTCGVYPSVDECLRIQPAAANPDIAAAIAHGKLAYHGDYARQCVDGLAAVSCDTTSHAARVQPDACKFMYEGTLADGATCNFDGECRARRCDVDPASSCDEGACCPGVCGGFALGDEGDACTRNVDCSEGLYCDPDLTCHVLGEDGADCLTDAQCDVGLACSTGACRAAGAVGDACPFGRCADTNAYCDASMTCATVGLPGDACDGATPCSPYFSCDAGKCTAIPALGAACVDRCAAGAWCNQTSKRCEAPQADGTPCDFGAQCTSGHCVEGPAFDECTTYDVCD